MNLDRIPNRQFSAAIGAALATVPVRIRDRLAHVRFVCGVDPIFAGIHDFAQSADGRSYRTTAHCCYPSHLIGPADRRTTTVVLPTVVPPYVIVHELGHALDHVVGFSHNARPVTAYARTNRQEAFAEAFTAWLYHYGDQDIARSDKATLALFSELAA